MRGFTDKALVLIPSDEGLENLAISDFLLFDGINNLINILSELNIESHLLRTNIDRENDLTSSFKIINNVPVEDRFTVDAWLPKLQQGMINSPALSPKWTKSTTPSRGMTKERIFAIYKNRIKAYSREIEKEYNLIVDIQRSKGKVITPKKVGGRILLSFNVDYFPKVFVGELETSVNKIFPEIHNPTAKLFDWRLL